MIWVVTAPGPVPDETSILRDLFSAGLETLLLRKPGWSAAAYETLLQALPADCRDRVMLSGYPELVVRYGLKGLHLSERLRGEVPGWGDLRGMGICVSTSVHEMSGGALVQGGSALVQGVGGGGVNTLLNVAGTSDMVRGVNTSFQVADAGCLEKGINTLLNVADAECLEKGVNTLPYAEEAEYTGEGVNTLLNVAGAGGDGVNTLLDVAGASDMEKGVNTSLQVADAGCLEKGVNTLPYAEEAEYTGEGVNTLLHPRVDDVEKGVNTSSHVANTGHTEEVVNTSDRMPNANRTASGVNTVPHHQGINHPSSSQTSNTTPVNPKDWDFLLLGPVFDSISKAGYKGRSFGHIPHNAIAIGGVTPSNLEKLQQMGFYGAAMLGAIWQQPEHAVEIFIKAKTSWK